MRVVTAAQYSAAGSIDATIDGAPVCVPDDPENSDRILIAEWEAAGNTIAVHVAPAPTAADVSAEAERRIEAGATISGVTFRTDDKTMIRLRGLIDAFVAGDVPQGGVTYRTSAGASITFSTEAEARAFYDAANLYRSAVLEASAALQTLDRIPADYSANERWPQP